MKNTCTVYVTLLIISQSRNVGRGRGGLHKDFFEIDFLVVSDREE